MLRIKPSFFIVVFIFFLTSNDWQFVSCFSQLPLLCDRGRIQGRRRKHVVKMDSGVSDAASNKNTFFSWDVLANTHILVVGGSGRVGGSVVVQLLKQGAFKVTVGGTSKERFQKAQSRWKSLYSHNSTMLQLLDNQINFVQVYRDNVTSVANALREANYNLVVHTAGPFQRKETATNGILQASTQARIPYVDVCDDYATSRMAQQLYTKEAKSHSVPCILSTGCWPGVSSLMAKQLTSHLLRSFPTLTPADLSVEFSFFTAGSGGAGSTLLVATFLILAEQALTIVRGRRVSVPPMRHYSRAHFGTVVGYKQVSHLNLLETASIHDLLGIGTIVTKFGTAPEYWNVLLGLMARLPSDWLANERWMEKLAFISLPIVRIVDYFAGATNAMRVDVFPTNNSNIRASAIYAHENLEDCVGECVVAFCVAILAGYARPGVWFPEEAILEDDATTGVLNLAGIGAHTLEATGVGTEHFWGR